MERGEVSAQNPEAVMTRPAATIASTVRHRRSDRCRAKARSPAKCSAHSGHWNCDPVRLAERPVTARPSRGRGRIERNDNPAASEAQIHIRRVRSLGSLCRAVRGPHSRLCGRLAYFAADGWCGHIRGRSDGAVDEPMPKVRGATRCGCEGRRERSARKLSELWREFR
jgi:hypothetical protein